MNDNGLAESLFVFHDGVAADKQFAENNHLVILETGFGTGLNFLASWGRWRQQQHCERLTFISVEGYPLSARDLAFAHHPYDSLRDQSHALRQALPPPAPGFHTRHFDGGRVTLLLLYGDALSCLQQLNARVDALFMDGFSPRMNPDIWSKEICSELYRLAKPGARLASFTAAGFVRRNLQEAGFDVRKGPGFGGKRERVLAAKPVGCAGNTCETQSRAPSHTQNHTKKKVAIIGGGIAGASAAYALGRRGINATLFTAGPALNASALPGAVLAPKLGLNTGPLARLQAACFAYSLQHPVLAAHLHDPRGLLQKPSTPDDANRLQKVADAYRWGEDWMTPTAEGLFWLKAGSLTPQDVLDDLLGGVDVRRHAVKAIRATEAGIALTTNDCSSECHDGRQAGYPAGSSGEFDIVINAMGPAAARLRGFPGVSDLPLKFTSGQTVSIAAGPAGGDCAANLPPHSQMGKHYLSAVDALGQRHIGASFTRHGSIPPSEDGLAADADIAGGLLASQGLSLGLAHSSWCGLRAGLPDYAPIADIRDFTGGRGGPQTALMTGFGSKGFQMAPLIAEALVARLIGDVDPFPASWWSAVASDRKPLKKSPIRDNAATE